MKIRSILTAAVLGGIATMAFAAQQVRFAAGHASVPLPDAFQVSASGEDLNATFGKAGDHQLEITLIKDLAGPGVADDSAVLFVEAQGRKKGVKVSRSGKRAVLMEAGQQEKRGDTTFQSAHWQIAVGTCLFTMTVTAPLPMSKELDEFLGESLNTIVQEISCGQS